MHEGKLDEAVGLLRMALELVPDQGKTWLVLAAICDTQGKLREERDALRMALRCELPEVVADKVRRSLASINEEIGND